jgi:hypothetical protein
LHDILELRRDGLQVVGDLNRGSSEYEFAYEVVEEIVNDIGNVKEIISQYTALTSSTSNHNVILSHALDHLHEGTLLRLNGQLSECGLYLLSGGITINTTEGSDSRLQSADGLDWVGKGDYG